MSTHQRWKPVIGPRCQRAVIACPASASTPMPTANDDPERRARRAAGAAAARIAKPPVTMTTSARTSHHDIGPHQKSSGAARFRPRTRKQMTRPMFDGLKMCSPRHLITYFESSETAAVPTKIHQPRSAPPVAVRRAGDAQDEGDAVAGQHRARRPHEHALAAGRRSRSRAPRTCRAPAGSARSRAWKWKPTCPITCSDVIVAARCRRGSRSFGRTTGYVVPRMTTAGAAAAGAFTAHTMLVG